MNSLLIKNASAVITCDSKDTVMEHANLLINNGVISYIGPEAQTADETLDASGTYQHASSSLSDIQPESPSSTEYGTFRLAHHLI